MTQGEKLTKWRKANDLSLVNLFTMLRVSSTSVISRLESDKYCPGLHLALDIEKMTGGVVRAADWPRRETAHEKADRLASEAAAAAEAKAKKPRSRSRAA